MSRNSRTFDVNDRNLGLDSLPLWGGDSAVPPRGSITGGTKYIEGVKSLKRSSNVKISDKVSKIEKLPKDMSLMPLTAGVDGLRVYVSGEVRSDVEELLNGQRQAAEIDKLGGGVGLAFSLLPPLYDAESVVKSYGAGGYAWLLDSADYEGKIARRRSVKEGFDPLPVAFFTVKQAALWRVGWRDALRQFLAWVVELFEDGAMVRPSRLDICIDFQGHDPSPVPNTQYVTKADTIRREDESGSGYLRQLSAGRSNHVRISLYRKSKDVATKGKDWQLRIWERTGAYDRELDVWRLEYQMGSEFLRERGINTLDDVIRQWAALWSYCLGWFSMRSPNLDDSNRSRWSEHEVWRGLRLWLCQGERAIAPRVKHAEQVSQRVKRSEDATVGHLTSLMHLHGDTDPLRAYERLMRSWERRREPFGDSIPVRLQKKRLSMVGLEGAAMG